MKCFLPRTYCNTFFFFGTATKKNVKLTSRQCHGTEVQTKGTRKEEERQLIHINPSFLFLEEFLRDSKKKVAPLILNADTQKSKGMMGVAYTFYPIIYLGLPNG